MGRLSFWLNAGVSGRDNRPLVRTTCGLIRGGQGRSMSIHATNTEVRCLDRLDNTCAPGAPFDVTHIYVLTRLATCIGLKRTST
jgi:hypothetical protein